VELLGFGFFRDCHIGIVFRVRGPRRGLEALEEVVRVQLVHLVGPLQTLQVQDGSVSVHGRHLPLLSHPGHNRLGVLFRQGAQKVVLRRGIVRVGVRLPLQSLQLQVTEHLTDGIAAAAAVRGTKPELTARNIHCCAAGHPR
jgi:hypothetical protein